MNERAAKQALIRLLQNAYSGELAAAHAYAGHAASVRDAAERQEILVIRDEELGHRACVREMLSTLGVEPRDSRERLMRIVGLMIGFVCRIGGWFIPMYGAGRLERSNIGEYEDAARLAVTAAREDLVDALLEMAEVEWDHEQYFRAKSESHWLRHVFPLWPAPPPRAQIRAAHSEHVRGLAPDAAAAPAQLAP